MTQKPLHLLLVDNYDSFTFNLKHLFEAPQINQKFSNGPNEPNEEASIRLSVRHNDDDFLAEVKAGQYDGAIIGPGPGSPEDERYFGFNKQLILDYGTKSPTDGGLPILGICLGFQGIYHYFGGKLRVGEHPVHGKASRLAIQSGPEISTPSQTPSQIPSLLNHIPDGASVMRYHSILADLDSAPQPDDIEICAYTYQDDSPNSPINYAEPMVLRHRKHPIFGMQFHPESFATQTGQRMAQNFIDICRHINQTAQR